MKARELIAEVQKKADTAPSRSKISAPDVSRSISLTFAVISRLPAAEAAAVIADLLKLGAKASVRAPARAKKAGKKKTTRSKKSA